MLILGAFRPGDDGEPSSLMACHRQLEAFYCQRDCTITTLIEDPRLILALAEPAGSDRHPKDRLVIDSGDHTFAFCGNRYGSEYDPFAMPGIEESELKILAAMFKKDPECIYQVSGDFIAFFYDRQSGRLTIARDHFGIRCLSYCVNHSNNLVAFSTSVSALRTIEWVSSELNRYALASLLVTFVPPAGETYFTEIKAVPPACTIEVRANTQVEVTRRWIPKPNMHWWSANKRNPVAAFQRMLRAAVISRVGPPGSTVLTVSGGLDSSGLAGVLTSECSQTNFHVLTEVLPPAYEGNIKDERSIVLELVDAMPQLIPHFLGTWDCEPFDTCALTCDLWSMPVSNFQSYFYLEAGKLVRQLGGTIIIGGYGGDQCVSTDSVGYPPELLLRGEIGNCLAQLRQISISRNIKLSSAFQTFLLAPLLPAWAMRLRERMLGRSWLHATALRKEFTSDRKLKRYLQRTGWTPLGIRARSLNDKCCKELEGLIKSAGLSSEGAFAPWLGVEYRFPLYDHRLIEAFLSIPSAFKACAGADRLLFRRSIEPFVPKFVMERVDKGPGSPGMLDYLKKNMRRMRAQFARFERNEIWRELVDTQEVERGLGLIANGTDLTFTMISLVVQPYFLGEFLTHLVAAEQSSLAAVCE